MGERLGVGIIGCGGIAHVHLNAWQASSDLCEVRALADPNPDALRSLHRKITSAATYMDYRALLDRSDIHVVDILTPPGLHWPVARDAIEAGKDVLIIKPFTVELRHADRLIDLARKRGVRLMVGHPLRFDPHLIKACELIRSGHIGQPTRFYARGFMRQEWLSKATGWFSNLALSGGVTIENIVHQTDLMTWMGGPVVSVYALSGTFHTANWPDGGLPDDQISILVRFNSGAIGVIEGGTAQPTGMPASMFEVVGTEGGISFDCNRLVVGRGVKERDGYAECFELRGHRGEVVMVRTLLEAIQAGKSVPVTAEEGRYAVEICWAALQSTQTGQPISLPLDPNHYPSYSTDD